jgi:hypothetical protein
VSFIRHAEPYMRSTHCSPWHRRSRMESRRRVLVDEQRRTCIPRVRKDYVPRRNKWRLKSTTDSVFFLLFLSLIFVLLLQPSPYWYRAFLEELLGFNSAKVVLQNVLFAKSTALPLVSCSFLLKKNQLTEMKVHRYSQCESYLRSFRLLWPAIVDNHSLSLSLSYSLPFQTWFVVIWKAHLLSKIQELDDEMTGRYFSLSPPSPYGAASRSQLTCVSRRYAYMPYKLTLDRLAFDFNKSLNLSVRIRPIYVQRNEVKWCF